MNIQSDNNLPSPVVLNPNEVIGIFADALAKRSTGVIYVRGIYRPGKGVPYGGYFYDFLKDELSARELTIIVTPEIRSKLSDGSLVDLKGLVERRVSNDCSVKLALHVTGMNVVQEHTISEDDLKRIEIRNAKAKAGFRNVDGILESAIYADLRPSVGLIFAEGYITSEDFNKWKEAAETQIDFTEYRVSFARPDAFVRMLHDVDDAEHDCICIVRGGGSGLEALDNLDVLECVAGLKTAVITAVGHTADKVFINEIADLELGTPSLLGSYFQNIVESISKKKSDSTAALTRKIETQFKQQLETARKQNAELQGKISELTKAHTEAQKASQKQLDDLAKGNDAARQKDREQMNALQKQLATLTETNKNQSESFTRQLGKLQGDISTLTNENKNLSARYAQERERREAVERSLQASRKARGRIGLVVAIIIIVILVLLGLQ